LQLNHSLPHGAGLREGTWPIRWHFSSHEKRFFLGLSSSGSPSHDAAHFHL
jgi:hypothetical protein